ncbi:MAG: hypothetical protein ACP5TI_03630 [Thermoprotei archaeon]
MATFTYDWDARAPLKPKFKILTESEFKEKFDWITASMDKGKDPVLGETAKKFIAKIFKWKISLITNDAGISSIWTANWQKSRGGPDARIYSLRFPREVANQKIASDDSAFFCPELMKYVTVNPSSYDELKTVAVRLVTSELAERDGNYLPINGSVASVLGKGVCLTAPRGLGKTTHVYGLAGWTGDSSTKFHSDGWFFYNLKNGEAISPEKRYYFRGFPSLSLNLRRLLSHPKKDVPKENEISKSMIVMDGFLADPKEFLGKEKSTKKCNVDMLVILKRDTSDQWLIKPLSSDDALTFLEEGYTADSAIREPYYNQFVVRDRVRDEKRKEMYKKFLSKVGIYLVNARDQPWITQTLIRGLALGEWKWAKLVNGQVYALMGEKYEPLFRVMSKEVEKAPRQTGLKRAHSSVA